MKTPAIASEWFRLALRTAIAAALLVTVACDSSDESPPVLSTGSGGDGGSGGGAGLGWSCPAGEQPLQDGTCLSAGEGAGIAPEQCATGFAPDGDGGCEPILPAAPCPFGQLAQLGETNCHEVAPCASGTWGDIPTEPNTQHVDQAYAGADSDGTADRPWTTIQEAIDAAEENAIVAVAAGAYVENVAATGKSIRLWGRCPALVEVVGATNASAIWLSSASFEVRDLALRGPGRGLRIQTSQALVDRVWVHDTGNDGVLALSSSTVTLRRSLVENTEFMGIGVFGAGATIESSVVRDTAPNADGDWGRGIIIQNYGGHRSGVAIRSSVIERSREVGINVMASDVSIEASLIRDTLPRASDGERGYGLYLHPDEATEERPLLDMSTSVLAGNHAAGINARGADLTLAATVVRDTQSEAASAWGGHALLVADSASTAQRSSASISSSLLANNRDVTVVVSGADVAIDGSIVRDTLPRQSDQRHGRGLDVGHSTASPGRSSLRLVSSLVEGSREAAVAATDADLTIEASIIRDTLPQLSDGQGGRGISMQYGLEQLAMATIRWSVVERSVEVGVFAGHGAELVLEGTVVRDTATGIDGWIGWGIAIQGNEPSALPSAATVRACLVAGNHAAGIAAVGADLLVEDTIVTGTSADDDGLFGDSITLLSDLVPVSATITGGRLESSARAAVASFGASVAIGSTDLACNPIDLHGEHFGVHTFSFSDLGGNECHCAGESSSCQVHSASLQPPDPLE